MAEVTGRHCVLVGNLNPAILSPQWVADKVFKQKAIKTKIEFTAALPQAIGAPLGPPRFSAQGIIWQPTNNRLEVHATDPEVDPGDFAAKVLDLLPHTPVRAVGNNVGVRLDATLVDLFKDLSRCRLQSLLTSDEHALVGFRTLVRLAHGDEAVLTVSFDHGGPEPPELRFNFHRDVKDAAAAAAAARSFQRDQQETVRVFDRVLVGVAH